LPGPAFCSLQLFWNLVYACIFRYDSASNETESTEVPLHGPMGRIRPRSWWHVPWCAAGSVSC